MSQSFQMGEEGIELGEPDDVHRSVMQQSSIRECEEMCANDYPDVSDDEEEEKYDELMIDESDDDDGDGEPNKAGAEVRIHKSYPHFFTNIEFGEYSRVDSLVSSAELNL